MKDVRILPLSTRHRRPQRGIEEEDDDEDDDEDESLLVSLVDGNQPYFISDY